MSDGAKSPIGSIVWHDLTVPNADEVRAFYSQVVGWKSEPVSMGDYDDFNMISPDDGQCAAGICHARGSNAKLPPQWLIYISVADADEAAAKCKKLGGKIIDGPRDMGEGRFCVIRDPAGAVAALYST